MKKSEKGRFPLKKAVRFSVYAGLALYAAVTLISQQNQMAQMTKLKADYEAKIKQQQQKVQDNKQREQDISSNAYVEKMARDKLGYVKDNERIFVDGAR